MNIVIMYSCVLCAVRDQSLSVPARMDPNSLVKEWVESTVTRVHADHLLRHPNCIAKELTDLKVPMDGASWVGGPAIQ